MTSFYSQNGSVCGNYRLSNFQAWNTLSDYQVGEGKDNIFTIVIQDFLVGELSRKFIQNHKFYD